MGSLEGGFRADGAGDRSWGLGQISAGNSGTLLAPGLPTGISLGPRHQQQQEGTGDTRWAETAK